MLRPADLGVSALLNWNGQELRGEAHPLNPTRMLGLPLRMRWPRHQAQSALLNEATPLTLEFGQLLIITGMHRKDPLHAVSSVSHQASVGPWKHGTKEMERKRRKQDPCITTAHIGIRPFLVLVSVPRRLREEDRRKSVRFPAHWQSPALVHLITARISAISLQQTFLPAAKSGRLPCFEARWHIATVKPSSRVSGPLLQAQP